MNRRTALKILLMSGAAAMIDPRFLRAADPKLPDKESVSAEHGMIGDTESGSGSHTTNPDAQWYPKAGLGLFLHWGIASVNAMNISWPMIPGRALAKTTLSPEELARVIHEHDWNLDGKPNSITPNQYWEQAETFDPQGFDPQKWCEAAKAAGCEYIVLTTKHHEGFALWPSAFGDFNTSTCAAGGRDLVKGYADACRVAGLKVGLYFSGPDWHFDRDYMSFMYSGAYRRNPGLPSLDTDLNPRTTKKSETDRAAHFEKFATLFKGQVEEILTRNGKIDLLWFDGKPAIPNPAQVMPLTRIRELQPGIVVNGRLHGHGDFYTYERTMPKTKTVAGWAELCNPWTGAWPYVKAAKYRSDGWALGELAFARSIGINYLLGVGPMSSGQLHPDAYKNLGVLAEWMKTNGIAVHEVQPLSSSESASVPAAAAGSNRFLYAIPKFNGSPSEENMIPPTDGQLTLNGVAKPSVVTLLRDGSVLSFQHAGNTLTIDLPAAKRTKLVDVVCVTLA